MNNYFLMSQKPDVGCPIGYTSVVLCAKFTPRIRSVEYGKFDWYRFKKGSRPLEQQFERGGRMCLISLDRRYRFDIRSIGGAEKMYAMSERFFQLASEIDASFDQLAQVEFVNIDNTPVSSVAYRVATIHRFKFEDIADRATSSCIEVGSLIEIQRLLIKDNFDKNLFSIAGTLAQQDSLICSLRAKESFERAGIRGVDFTDLREVDWPKNSPPNSTSDILATLLGEKNPFHIL